MRVMLTKTMSRSLAEDDIIVYTPYIYVTVLQWFV